MTVIFELEAAKSMWMRMGNPSNWVEHPVAKGEIFHVEVKPVDPKSKTRIPYADVNFSAVPVTTKFHFKLSSGKLVEVTEPAPEPK